MKATVDDGVSGCGWRGLTWKNRTEHGEQAAKASAFYVPLNPPPEIYAVLARALLKAPARKLALLPSGEARIEVGERVVLNDAAKTILTQYRITGLNFSPTPIWLDAQGQSVAEWRIELVLPGWKATGYTAKPHVTARQQQADGDGLSVGASRAESDACAERRSRDPPRAPVRST